jgi:hypothetical protein
MIQRRREEEESYKQFSIKNFTKRGPDKIRNGGIARGYRVEGWRWGASSL